MAGLSVSSTTTTTGELPLQPAPPLERGASVGRYLVVERLGEGGMGVVYAAYDPELNRKVAVKLLRATRAGTTGPDEGQARLVREAQAMARVAHPNVVTVHDVGTLGDRVFVAMEFVEGLTLTRWVKAKPRSWREVLAAFLDAGRGLAAAHAVGLVHRDFKPDNVLIGKDGRVRVMDFGLARLDTSPTTATQPNLPALDLPRGGKAAGGPDLSEALTQAGEVMGTPQYMSPEQRLGLTADARSDQFSFCAALYWALYRQPPFDPLQLAAAAIDAEDASPPADAEGTSGERRLAFTRSVIREPPQKPAVPAWLKRAMLRGLSLAPQDRFPSMDALLAALGTEPGAVRRRWVVAAIGAGLLLAGGGLVYQQVERRQQLCSGAERSLSGVWDGPTQRAIQAAFGATGKPYAAASWQGVKQLLDAYSGGWVAMSREACEDTRIRGIQTEQLLSLRTVCLDRRLKELRALTQLLSSADGQAVDRAVDAANALPSLRHCADVEALSTPVSPPDDPAVRVKLEKLGSTLASARALHAAGKYKQAMEQAAAATATAGEVRYLPLKAEALQLLGWTQLKAGDTRQGVDNLTEAVWTAEAGREDRVKAAAAVDLAFGVGYLQGHFDEAQPWLKLAGATLDRIGGDDELQFELLMHQAAVYRRAGHPELAQDPYERAEALAKKAMGPSSTQRALALTGLGQSYVHQRQYARARQVLLESLDIIEKTRGPDHPNAAFAHDSLADVLQAEGDLPQALLHARRELAILETSLGPERPQVATAHEGVASILMDQKDFPEALAEYQRALEIRRKTLSPEDPELGYALGGVGNAYVNLGRWREALPYLERALQLRKAAPNTAGIRFALAQALWESRDARSRSRALSLATQARAELLAAGESKGVEEVDRWLAGRAASPRSSRP